MTAPEAPAEADIREFLRQGGNSNNILRCCLAVLGWAGLRASDAERPEFLRRIARAIDSRSRRSAAKRGRQ